MPRKPRKRTQTRIRKGVDVWVRWNNNPFRAFPVEEDPWENDKEIRAFWEKNRAEIMRLVERQNQERNNPFHRPDEYWEDIEKEHPREIIGFVGKDPISENDAHYLSRLGLLFDWENSHREQEGIDNAKR